MGSLVKTCTLPWSEEVGLLLHLITFPEGQSVKLLNLHPKDLKKEFWSQVALERDKAEGRDGTC